MSEEWQKRLSKMMVRSCLYTAHSYKKKVKPHNIIWDNPNAIWGRTTWKPKYGYCHKFKVTLWCPGSQLSQMLWLLLLSVNQGRDLWHKKNVLQAGVRRQVEINLKTNYWLSNSCWASLGTARDSWHIFSTKIRDRDSLQRFFKMHDLSGLIKTFQDSFSRLARLSETCKTFSKIAQVFKWL